MACTDHATGTRIGRVKSFSRYSKLMIRFMRFSDADMEFRMAQEQKVRSVKRLKSF